MSSNSSKLSVFKKSSANEKVTIFMETRDIAETNCATGVVVIDSNFFQDKCIFIELCCSFRFGHEDDEMFGLKFEINTILASEQLYVPPIEPVQIQQESEPQQDQRPGEEQEQPPQEEGETKNDANTDTPTNSAVEKIEEVQTPDPPSPSPSVLPKTKFPNNLTLFQERIIKKFGSSNAFPFALPFHTDSPSSVTIESGRVNPKGKPVGLEYFIKSYAGDHQKDYTNKNSTVQMAIRKIQYAPKRKKGKSPAVNTPRTIVRKGFFMSRGEIEMSVSLDKQIYHHGDTLKIVLGIQNKSGRTITKYKTSIEQHVFMSIFKYGGRKKNVITSFTESEYGVPIPSQGKLNTFVHLTPTLGDNIGRRGIAKDVQLRLEDGTTLASSSLFADPNDDSAFGIVVSYCVKVKLYLGMFGGVVTAEIPFFLMHPEHGPTKTFMSRYKRTQSLYY